MTAPLAGNYAEPVTERPGTRTGVPMPSSRRHAVIAATVVLAMAACGDDGDEVQQLEDRARGAVTTVAKGAEGLTRLNATLTGPAEVPGPGDPDGAGTAVVNVDANKGEVCYDISVQKLDQPVAMHIHEGGADKSGPVVINLTTPAASDVTTTGCNKPEATLIARMVAKPADFYVNVHTGPYPQGAVRGQLSQ